MHIPVIVFIVIITYVFGSCTMMMHFFFNLATKEGEQQKNGFADANFYTWHEDTLYYKKHYDDEVFERKFEQLSVLPPK